MTIAAVNALCSRIPWCKPAVLESVLEPALEIAREGREGRRMLGTQRRKHERSVCAAREKCRPCRPGQHRQAPWIACASGTSTRPMSPSTVTR
jgi:hypothetical protein